MTGLDYVLTRPTMKPFRTKDVEKDDAEVYLDKDGLVAFSPTDPENPKNWSMTRRWIITVVLNMIVINATFASSAPSGAEESLMRDFHISSEVSALVTTLFLCGYCTGPLFWAPLCEYFGRRWVLYLTFFSYWAFNFLCAFTPNLGGLLVGRYLCGTFAASLLSNSPAVLADLWGPLERGNAMALFVTMNFAGPALGPIIAGFLNINQGWRWTYYVLIWMGFGTMCMMLLVPETSSARILHAKAIRIRAKKIPGLENVLSPAEASGKSLGSIMKTALTRPWKIFFDPISFLSAIYMSVVYMLLYMLFTIYPLVFQGKRHWNTGVGELPLLGTLIGASLGGIIVWAVSKRDVKRDLAGKPRKPEDRLPLAMVGAILFPVTMFWFSWTANYNSIHWIVPCLAGTFLATSILLIFVSYMNYLTDTYLMFAASALASNTIMRSACAAASPLFATQMFGALGIGGGGSLIAGVGCLMLPIPFVFHKYGEKIRAKSKFAPTVAGSGPTPPVGDKTAPQPAQPSRASQMVNQPMALGPEREMRDATKDKDTLGKHDDESDDEDDYESDDEAGASGSPGHTKKNHDDYKERMPTQTDIALHRLSQRIASAPSWRQSAEIPVQYDSRMQPGDRESTHAASSSVPPVRNMMPPRQTSNLSQQYRPNQL